MGIFGSEQSGGGGGGAPVVVTHTLTTVPGYGVTVSATVADYAALTTLNPANGTCTLVLTGEEGANEYWIKTTTGQYAGPYDAWITNPKYQVGSNGEDILLVNVGYTNIDRHPMGASLFVNDLGSDSAVEHAGSNTNKCKRTKYTVPIFISNSLTKTVSIVNTESSISNWVGIHNLQNIGSSSSVLDPVTGAYTSYNVLILPGRLTKVDVMPFNGQFYHSARTAAMVADMPSRYQPSSTDYSDYMSTYAGSSGVIEWDTNTLPLPITTKEEILASTNTTYNIDLLTVKLTTVIVSSNCTLQLSNNYSSNPNTLDNLVEVVNGGAYSVVWNASNIIGTLYWQGGSQPTLATTGSTLIRFITDSMSGKVYGSVVYSA